MIQHIVLTGGNGYIGRRVAQLAVKKGLRVTCLSCKNYKLGDGVMMVKWSLGSPMPRLDVVPEETAIIHLAHDWKNQPDKDGEEGGLNRAGTALLRKSAEDAGIHRFVFVSSQSAREDAANIYGRVKWKIEQSLEGHGCVSARVGLVYGGPRKATFGLLNKLVSKLPFLPMVGSGREVQPIALDEVAAGLLALADGKQEGWRGLAGPTPMPFGKALVTLGREAHGRRIVIVPVPLQLALLAVKFLSVIPFLPKIDKERILGLAGTRAMLCVDHLKEMGLEVAPMETGLRRLPLGTRGLLGEAKVLLSYVLSSAPPTSLMRRYVRAIRIREGMTGPVGLFPLFIHAPFFLRFIEPLNRTTTLAKRMDVAVSLVYASRPGAKMLKFSRSHRLVTVALSLMVDAVAVPFRLVGLIGRKR